MEPIPLTNEILLEIGVERYNIIYWIKNYTVNGKKIGIKIGGRWYIYPELLEKLLDGDKDELPVIRTGSVGRPKVVRN